MAKQTINLGTSANSGGGDPLRTALQKVNENFDELYADIVALEDGQIATNIKGSVFADDSTLLVDAVNGIIPWTVVDSTPATLAGYGITDAFDGEYSSLTSVPSTFTPSAHNQAWSTITSTPTTLAGYGITDGGGSATLPVQTVVMAALSSSSGSPTLLDLTTYSGLVINAPVGGTTRYIQIPNGTISGQRFFFTRLGAGGDPVLATITLPDGTTGDPYVETNAIEGEYVWTGTFWARLA